MIRIAQKVRQPLKLSMKMRKPKVILAQVEERMPGGFPLAGAYLKAMAYKMDLLSRFDIEVLALKFNCLCGDHRLISYIVGNQPSCVGFTCYIWNLERTLYVIEQIKKKLPKVKIVCGGLEACTQYKKLMANRNIDVIVRGEGELTFVELLRNILYDKPKLEEINGIVFRSKDALIVTPEREPMPDINSIPSPYLHGLVDVSEYGTIKMETYRGCINKCAYCHYWGIYNRGVRFFDQERIRKELVFAHKNNLAVHVLDPNFNLPKSLARLSKVAKEIGRDNLPMFKWVDGRAEFINEKTVKQLSRFKFNFLEIGLQTTHPQALDNIGRWFDEKSFVRGIELLKKKGISFIIDILLGIPGDTEASISKTLQFVAKFNCGMFRDLLRVEPGTILRKTAKSLNLKHMQNAPYYVRSTGELSYRTLKKISRNFFPHFIEKEKSMRKPWTTEPPTFYFLKEDYKKIAMCAGGDRLAGDFFLLINNKIQSLGQVKELSVKLKQLVHLRCSLFFKCNDLNHDFRIMRELLYLISKENPYSRYEVSIDNEEPFDCNILDKLGKAIIYKLTYTDREKDYKLKLLDCARLRKHSQEKCHFIFYQPFSRQNLLSMRRVGMRVPLIWKLLLTETSDWRGLLKEVLHAPYGDLFVQFGSNRNNLPFINEVLQYLFKAKKKGKAVHFSDYAFHLFYYEILIGGKAAQDVIPAIFRQESTVYVDEYCNSSFWEYDVAGCIKKLNALNKFQKNIRLPFYSVPYACN